MFWWTHYSLQLSFQAQGFPFLTLPDFHPRKQHDIFISILQPRPPSYPPPQTILRFLIPSTLPCSSFLTSTKTSTPTPHPTISQRTLSLTLRLLGFFFSFSSHRFPIPLPSPPSPASLSVFYLHSLTDSSTQQRTTRSTSLGYKPLHIRSVLPLVFKVVDFVISTPRPSLAYEFVLKPQAKTYSALPLEYRSIY